MEDRVEPVLGQGRALEVFVGLELRGPPLAFLGGDDVLPLGLGEGRECFVVWWGRKEKKESG